MGFALLQINIDLDSSASATSSASTYRASSPMTHATLTTLTSTSRASSTSSRCLDSIPLLPHASSVDCLSYASRREKKTDALHQLARCYGSTLASKCSPLVDGKSLTLPMTPHSVPASLPSSTEASVSQRRSLLLASCNSMP
ncbi:hypothetical protein AAC387_Pa06g3274 [Persea americana]